MRAVGIFCREKCGTCENPHSKSGLPQADQRPQFRYQDERGSYANQTTTASGATR